MWAARNSVRPSFGSFGRYLVASNTTRSGLPSSPASQSVVTSACIAFPQSVVHPANLAMGRLDIRCLGRRIALRARGCADTEGALRRRVMARRNLTRPRMFAQRQAVLPRLARRGVGRNAASLQSKLRDLVDGCDAVICLLGWRSGSYPPTGVASRFANLLPAGIEEASRTQWEFLFARSLSKPWRLFRADAGLAPDNPAPTGQDFPDRQTAWLAWMDANDFPRTSFRSIQHLLAEVVKI